MGKNVFIIREFDLEQEPPINSLIKIVQMYNKRIESKQTPVTLMTINSRGLRFQSYLSLPIDENIIWSFQLLLREKPFLAEGVLTGVHKMDEGFEYGVEWVKREEVGHFVLKSFVAPHPAITHAVQSYAFFNEISPERQQIDLLC